MTGSDEVLFDSNVLVYNQTQESDFYQQASEFHRKVFHGELPAVVACQNFTEFLTVIANAKRTPKPLTITQATMEVKRYINSGKFRLIFPNEKTMPTFLRLMTFLKIKDPRDAFDVFLAATMLSNGVKTILTANETDFSSIPNIKVIKLA